MRKSAYLRFVNKETEIRVYDRTGSGSFAKREWVLYDCDGRTSLASGETEGAGAESAAWAAARSAKCDHYMKTRRTK